MAYFKNFPQITYKGYTVKDLTRRIRIKRIVNETLDSFEPYRIQDGETPEQLAHDFYGDSNLHWVILMFNDIIDPLYGWVLTSSDLLDYVRIIYGAGNEYLVHHYTLDGQTVPQATPGAIAVSNFEYEDGKNEAKREIKIVHPRFIEEIQREFDRLIAQ